jgi:hypothetical protein
MVEIMSEAENRGEQCSMQRQISIAATPLSAACQLPSALPLYPTCRATTALPPAADSRHDWFTETTYREAVRALRAYGVSSLIEGQSLM